jgi:hypothetical protein
MRHAELICARHAEHTKACFTNAAGNNAALFTGLDSNRDRQHLIRGRERSLLAQTWGLPMRRNLAERHSQLRATLFGLSSFPGRLAEQGEGDVPSRSSEQITRQ